LDRWNLRLLPKRGKKKMISRQRFDDVREKYCHYASWAVWGAEGEKPKDGIGDISFFDDPTDEFLRILNPEVVLVGLNISRAVERPLGNFHPDYPKAQDYKLRFALRGTRFWGGYLTDVIKDFEEKVSGKVRTYLRANPNFEAENIALFSEELEAVGATKPTLVALGGDSHAILTRNFGSKFTILKAPHYAMWINPEEYRRRVGELQ
jgi:hypothetical protein